MVSKNFIESVTLETLEKASTLSKNLIDNVAPETATATMNLLKSVKTRSFLSSKKNRSANSAADEAAGGDIVSRADSPAANIEDQTSARTSPPTSSSQEAIVVPPSPSQLSPSKRHSSARPLRVGSFNFDNPTGQSRSLQTRKKLTAAPLFHEANDMVNLSILIYTLVELRDLARNGVLENPAQSMRILKTPLPLHTALEIIVQESELLKEVLDDGKHEATLSSLNSLLNRQQEVRALKEEKENVVEEENKPDGGGLFSWMTSCDGILAGGFAFDELFCGGNLGMVDGGDKNDSSANAAQEELDSSVITTVADVKSNEELVYAVGVNPVEERITVIFRGSVTKADFITDSKISLVQAPDPQSSDFNDSVGIHQGFYEYLFGEKGSKPSKYTEVMNHVEQLLAENPARKNYNLYITGHSLGGALATLFGFYAVGSPSMPLPVTVVSVASPRVGNISFARAFAEMESQGKIRHLRIANHKDPVTLGPTVSSKRALALSAKTFSPLGYLALMLSGNDEGGEEEVYFHTGIKLKLFKSVSAVSSQRCELSYSGATIISNAKKPVANDKAELAEIELSNKKKTGMPSELPMISYHYGNSYSDRMALVESDLKGLTLNSVYRDKVSEISWAS